jgi:putative flippase GtrA
MSLPSRLFDLHLFGKHQLAAVAATAIDFAVMIALVELAKLSPPVATVAGAICGGVTNFTVGRAWAFRDLHTGSLQGQAARYAVVSLGGALLNAGLLALVLAAVSLPYVLGRVFVSAAVSALYTYPMHTRVVFRAHDGGAVPPEVTRSCALEERA